MDNYGFVDVEGGPHFVDLGSAVLVAELGSRESQELCEVDASGLIVVKFGQDLVNELVLAAESELLEGSLELLGIDDSAEIAVEDVEGGLDISNFLNWDGESGIILSLPDFLLWRLGLRRGLACRGLGWCFAHPLKYLI